MTNLKLLVKYLVYRQNVSRCTVDYFILYG